MQSTREEGDEQESVFSDASISDDVCVADGQSADGQVCRSSAQRNTAQRHTIPQELDRSDRIRLPAASGLTVALKVTA